MDTGYKFGDAVPLIIDADKMRDDWQAPVTCDLCGGTFARDDTHTIESWTFCKKCCSSKYYQVGRIIGHGEFPR